MGEPTEVEVLARAKRNFISKNHNDRAWDAGFTEREVRQGHIVSCLTEFERQEYLDQARHELRAISPAERSDRCKAARNQQIAKPATQQSETARGTRPNFAQQYTSCRNRDADWSTFRQDQ